VIKYWLGVGGGFVPTDGGYGEYGDLEVPYKGGGPPCVRGVDGGYGSGRIGVQSLMGNWWGFYPHGWGHGEWRDLTVIYNLGGGHHGQGGGWEYGGIKIRTQSWWESHKILEGELVGVLSPRMGGIGNKGIRR